MSNTQEEFFLEIEPNFEREINQEEPNKQRLKNENTSLQQDFTSEKQQSNSNKQNHRNEDASLHKTNERPSKQDRSLPPDMGKKYYVKSAKNGDQHIFADAKGQREIFQESENRLRTKMSDKRAIKLMMDTASHRGWNNIKIRGVEEFRREAWLEGQSRGISVRGYKPTELDLQELKQREQSYLRNEIAPLQKEKSIQRNEANQNVEASQQQKQQPRINYKDGVQGILIESGSRPYQDDKDNDFSPYVILGDEQGNKHTIWGVGLPDALLDANAKRGDFIHLKETGMETVIKDVLRKVDGKFIRAPEEVQRRGWKATVLKEQNRETNDERLAREYQTNTRAISAQSPDLKKAAMIETYVERKLKKEFPNDPKSIDQGMTVARVKISEAIAQAKDFPTPHVVEKRHLEKTTKEQSVKNHKSREQIRMQERNR